LTLCIWHDVRNSQISGRYSDCWQPDGLAPTIRIMRKLYVGRDDLNISPDGGLVDVSHCTAVWAGQSEANHPTPSTLKNLTIFDTPPCFFRTLVSFEALLETAAPLSASCHE
jgi:hypothetical protein